MKINKRILSVLLCVALMLSVMSVAAFAEGTRTVISEIRATSNITEPKYGEIATKPTFTIVSGEGAYFATNNGGWRPGIGQKSQPFVEDEYYYKTQVRIDKENAKLYELSESLKVYVNDVEWEVGTVSNFDTYCMVWVVSPKTTVTEPEGLPFVVSKTGNYSIDKGNVGTKITNLDLSKCVTGGRKPYTYTKISGPEWITLSVDGMISGTRPSTKCDATTLVVRISDSQGAYDEITIPVGRVYDTSLRTPIDKVVLTSDMKASYRIGDKVVVPKFTIVNNAPIRVATNNGGWYPGQLHSGTFSTGDYYYYTQIRIENADAENYCFGENVEIIVDGIAWTCDEGYNTDTYCMAWIESPTYHIAANTVSGTVTSFGEDSQSATVTLTKQGESTPAYSTTVTGTSVNCNFSDVEYATYTLKVSKENHATREYTVVVNSDEVKQDVKIQLKGDVNGDGKVNRKDYTVFSRYVSEMINPTGYELAVMDIKTDGKFSSKDLTVIKNHITGVTPLF